MGLKHYQGSTPGARAPWTCPSCGTENLGPLEQGCTNCRAGADATKVTAKPGYEAQAETVRQLLPALDARAAEVREKAFDAWLLARAATKGPMYDYTLVQLAHEAFMGALDWVETGGLAVPYVTGTRAEPMSHIESLVDGGILLDDPTVRATLAAALAFYIDNTLAYGAVPGQLDQQQARALLAQLQPPEEPPDAAPTAAPDPDIPF